MDLTKLQGSSFNKSGLFGQQAEPEESVIQTFLIDTAESKLTSSVGDLLNATRSRSQRQFNVSDKNIKLIGSSSTPALQTPGTGTGTGNRPESRGNESRKSKRNGGNDSSQGGRSKPFDTSFNVVEKPASRVDIVNL
jgi:hypothetical protein